jgi:hypothetical protein
VRFRFWTRPFDQVDARAGIIVFQLHQHGPASDCVRQQIEHRTEAGLVKIRFASRRKILHHLEAEQP